MATRENRKRSVENKCRGQKKRTEKEEREREESVERGSKASAQQKHTWKLNIRETLVGEKCEFISSARSREKRFRF